MARKSNGWLIVSIGPNGPRGKFSQTVREKEAAGDCDHCGRYRKVLFSYDDDGFCYCNRGCWVAGTLIRGGVRTPTKQQRAEQARRKRRTVVRRPALALVPPNGNVA